MIEMEREFLGSNIRASGRDLGQLEPYFGRWVWPLREMQVGDTFTVAQSDRPIGAVRNYVSGEQLRLGRKFAVIKEGDKARVTALPDNATPAERAAWRSVPVFKCAPDIDNPEDEEIFLSGFKGILQPPTDGENWRWPFNSMEPGEWFLVDKQHKEPEQIRRSAHSLARPHGLAVSVNIDPPEHPGFVRIEAKAPRPSGLERAITTYKTAREIVARCYGVNLDSLKWAEVGPGGSTYCNYDLTVPPAYPYVVFRAGERFDQTFGIHLSNRGLLIKKLPDGWTLFQWLDQMRKQGNGPDLEVDPFS